MRFNKCNKAQISVFIIIGLIVLIISGVAYSQFINNIERVKTNADEDKILNRQAEQITTYVEKCLYEVSVNGAYVVGWQGGVFSDIYQGEQKDNNPPFEIHGLIRVPFWYFDGKDYSPAKSDLEENLENYILKKSENCTNFDSLISLEGTNIILPEKNQIGANISINTKDMTLVYSYPIDLVRSDYRKKISQFNARVPVPLGQTFDLSKELYQKILSSDSYSLMNDCSYIYNQGMFTAYSFNKRIQINNYETLLNPKIGRTLTFQFIIENKQILGICPGK
jgi:hypothetical protein